MFPTVRCRVSFTLSVTFCPSNSQRYFKSFLILALVIFRGLNLLSGLFTVIRGRGGLKIFQTESDNAFLLHFWPPRVHKIFDGYKYLMKSKIVFFGKYGVPRGYPFSKTRRKALFMALKSVLYNAFPKISHLTLVCMIDIKQGLIKCACSFKTINSRSILYSSIGCFSVMP